MTKKFMKMNSKSFWAEIKKINGKDKSILSSTVNGISGNNGIVNMWHDHYNKLLNLTNNEANKQYVTDKFKECKEDDFSCFTF